MHNESTWLKKKTQKATRGRKKSPVVNTSIVLLVLLFSLSFNLSRYSRLIFIVDIVSREQWKYLLAFHLVLTPRANRTGAAHGLKQPIITSAWNENVHDRCVWNNKVMEICSRKIERHSRFWGLSRMEIFLEEYSLYVDRTELV